MRKENKMMTNTVKSGVYTYNKETLLDCAEKLLNVLATDKRISNTEYLSVAKVLSKKFGTEIQ